MQEAKVNKKPRTKKAVPADKIVSKMKYLKTDQATKLVSINPTDILGSKEFWVYNTKTRKLGKYVAAEFQELSVKGTSITGFDEIKSVQKTLRKPEEQLKDFKSAGKVQLRKFLDDIKAVDIKLNGRINEDTILLKTQ
jgi:DNA-directed RNA polymerase alpha subunit